jgi:phytoene synthase
MAAALSATDAAYRECERITRTEAGNFYYGIRLLPGAKRGAMCAVYAFARRVDDIGDGDLEAPRKIASLDQLTAALTAALTASEAPLAGERNGAVDPVLAALAHACTDFPLPRDAFDGLLEGVRMDVTGAHYESFEELVVYCRRVAGGIGRLCLAIFGVTDPRAASWAYTAADELGVALQLTNILRDVREDAARDRVYIPREDLLRFGVPGIGDDAAGDPGALLALPADCAQFDALVHFEAQRAREWFARGMTLLQQLDRRSAACVLAMAGIYRRLLDHIDARPSATLTGRVALPRHEKLWVATQGLMGVGA